MYKTISYVTMIKDERLVENLYDRTQNVAAYNDL